MEHISNLITELILFLPENWQPYAALVVLIVIVALGGRVAFFWFRQKGRKSVSENKPRPNINEDTLLKLLETFRQTSSLSQKDITKLAKKAAELDITKPLMKSLVETIHERDIPPEEWSKALSEAATAFNNAKTELEALRSIAGQSKELEAALNSARQALDEVGGIDIKGAEKALRDARLKWISQRDQQRKKQDKLTVRVLIAEAELATSRFGHDRAAELWEDASVYLDGREKIPLLDRAGDAWKKAGDLSDKLARAA